MSNVIHLSFDGNTSVAHASVSESNNFPSFFAGKDYWAPSPTGNRAEDWEIGKTLASEMIEHLKIDNQCPAILGHTMDAMMRRGKFDDIEGGFFWALAEHLMA